MVFPPTDPMNAFEKIEALLVIHFGLCGTTHLVAVVDGGFAFVDTVSDRFMLR